jgi:hypothetical protein
MYQYMMVRRQGDEDMYTGAPAGFHDSNHAMHDTIHDSTIHDSNPGMAPMPGAAVRNNH